MSSTHNHNGTSVTRENNLLFTIVIIAIAMGVEIVGGIMSNSLALLSDAGHMFTDLVALILSWSAYKIAMKKSDTRRSYGYHRFQVVAAFINGMTLFIIAFVIIFESIKRFMYPIEINWQVMLITAVIGLIANIITFFLLYSKDESNLNVKSAVLHIIGDLLGSVAAIIASFIIMIFGWKVVDPILSIVVSIIILNGAFKIIKSSGHILLEGTPDETDPEDVKNYLITNIPAILDVHHIHIWSLTTEHPIMTMHIKIDKQADYTSTLYSIKKALVITFNIAHATIEIEYESCADDQFNTHSHN